jgi:hypothetical protein
MVFRDLLLLVISEVRVELSRCCSSSVKEHHTRYVECSDVIVDVSLNNNC